MTAMQRLPLGAEREALRQKGQFWTPAWVAEAMVAYALGGGSPHLFDPAVGAGAFFRAAKVVSEQMGRTVALLGAEVDPRALDEALATGLTAQDLALVEVRDFVLDPPERTFAAIVANPPYIRHHRLSPETKARLREINQRIVGQRLDGRAGLHVHFLVRALSLLSENGRLAFIVPADICEGVFAKTLWRWIAGHFRLDAVITFRPEAAPFPGVDTNALVIFIRKDRPSDRLRWAVCHAADPRDLTAWALAGLAQAPPSLAVLERDLAEALDTGLSRAPHGLGADAPRLGEYASVMRGIATGANDFFFLTRERAGRLGIPEGFLLPAVGRTRDVPDEVVSARLLAELEAQGRPTLLLNLDGRPLEAFPPRVRDYIQRGVALGLPQRALISTRSPWYKMEVRKPPPILFAYLGRRSVRFIRNEARVVPLTGFLCVYPHRDDPESLALLWELLQAPETLENLRLVAKSYGDGALKVEPRALEQLPLPWRIPELAGARLVQRQMF